MIPTHTNNNGISIPNIICKSIFTLKAPAIQIIESYNKMMEDQKSSFGCAFKPGNYQINFDINYNNQTIQVYTTPICR